MRRGWVVLLGLGMLLAAGCSTVRRPRVAARAIGMLGSGTVPVRIVVLGTEPPEPRSVLVGEREN